MKIEKEVEDFIKTINRKPLKEYFPKETAEEKKIEIDWNKDDIYVEALYQGYLDACRTFEWSEKVKEDHPNEKRKGYIEGKFKNDIACKIREYLNNPKSQLFAVFHGKLCENLKECFRKEETNITHGQAQKIVNMAFKYLYCLYYEYGKLKEDQFADCHMPLDSFSLEWFKRRFKNDDFSNEKEALKLTEKLFKDKNGNLLLKAGAIDSWSSMESVGDEKESNIYQGEKYPYEFYSDKINAYCKKSHNIKSPLELDFFVWSKMQKIMAAEAFIKTFKESTGDEAEKLKSKKYDVNELEKLLEEKMDEIKLLIGE